jgi:hypothetical protein
LSELCLLAIIVKISYQISWPMSTDGFVATVPVFDVKALLIAFLNGPLQMRGAIFASNYNIFMEKAKLPMSALDELDTEPARQR